MKQLLLSLSLLLAIPAAAQFSSPPIDSTSGKIAYATIIQVPGVTQVQLYKRALKWLATVEPHTLNVPPVTDVNRGILTTSVGLPFTVRLVGGSTRATLWRDLHVTVKNGEAKCEFSAFVVQPYVASTSFTVPSKAQLKLTAAEKYFDRGNMLYYDKQGQPKAYTSSVLGAIKQQNAALLTSLEAALAKSDDL